MSRFFFAFSCALAIGVGAWKCKPAFHEGVASNSCFKRCAATPQVSVNKYNTRQFYWQHCDGTVYTASYRDNGEGLQGNNGPNARVYSNASQLVKNARLLSAGDQYGLVVLQSGDVMAFGRNVNGGKLGIGDDRIGDTIYDGATVVLPGKATSVSASYTHTLFATADGKAYAAGSNSNGHLCRPFENVSTTGTPLQVPLPEDAFVVDVSAGRYHSMFLTKDGRVYACGRNDFGRLGIGNTSGIYRTPQLVSVQYVVAIAAGDAHTVFLQRDGVALVTGSNREGRIGLGRNVEKVGTPTKLDLKHVVAISAGQQHSMFLLCDGTVYGTGFNREFQLAVGHNEQVFIPTKAYYEDVVAISTGDYTSMFLTSGGKLHISGAQESYQIAVPVGVEVLGFGWQNKPHKGEGVLKRFEQQVSFTADSAVGGNRGFLPNSAMGALVFGLLSIVSAALLPTIRRARSAWSEQADLRPLVEGGEAEEEGCEGDVGQRVC